MKNVKIILWLHVILGPIAVWICAYDWSHPERWDVWFRNPAYAKPFLIAAEAFIWCGVAYPVWRAAKAKRMQQGIEKLQEALRLLDAGRVKEADELYMEGKRLTGQR